MDTIDLVKLASLVCEDNSRIPYEPNKHRFTKVAFDVFQLNSSPIESLWILEQGEDGKQYLAAMYSEQEDTEKLEAKSSWQTLLDKEAKNITLTYKDVPVKRFASSEYGFTKDDAHIFEKTLVEKLSSDKNFVEMLLKLQSEETRNFLIKKFPELV